MPDFRYTPTLWSSSPPSILGDALDDAERLGDPELQTLTSPECEHPAVVAYRAAWWQIHGARKRPKPHPKHPHLQLEAARAIARDASDAMGHRGYARQLALAGDPRFTPLFHYICVRAQIDAAFRWQIAHDDAELLENQARRRRRLSRQERAARIEREEEEARRTITIPERDCVW